MKSVFCRFIIFMRILFLLCLTVNNAAVFTQERPKPRLIITTDIGGDPDDQQSLVRLFLYLNEFQLEGIIVSASGTPGELGVDTIRPDLVHKTIDAYSKVQKNLSLHDYTFPHADYLHSIVKKGNPKRGIAQIGKDHDTEGSEWLLSKLSDATSGQLNISIWGGSTDLAQALWKIKNTKRLPEQFMIFSNLRIYSVNNQDETGKWIMEQFPQLFYILSRSKPGEDKRNAVYRGMYLGGDESLTSCQWINDNIVSGHGELCSLYPDEAWTLPNPFGCMKEGDTPSWFFFLQNGLSNADHPDWGSWGGRYLMAAASQYTDACDSLYDSCSRHKTVYRWRSDFQNDFAARADWCVLPLNKCNHQPRAIVNSDKTLNAFIINSPQKNEILLDASESFDIENNKLTFRWYADSNASPLSDKIKFNSPDVMFTTIDVSRLPSGSMAHIILEVSDNGSPSLKAYRRIIIIK